MWKNALYSIVGGRLARSQEAKLLRSDLRARSDHPSLLFLTVHKAASTYVGQLLRRIAKSERIIPIDLAGFCYGHSSNVVNRYMSPELVSGITGKPLEWSDEIQRELTGIVRPRGFMYGPLRTGSFLVRLPNFDRFRVLIQLRDPRDVLTSFYFSIAYSHGLPGRNSKISQRIQTQRDEARSESIDSFVLKHASMFAERYREYCHEILPRANVRLVKYEDMVTDFPRWLAHVLQHWGFHPGTKTAAKLMKEADFEVSEERQTCHKRQVKPGDHLRKLQPRTIDFLNSQFSDVLVRLGYASTRRRFAAAA